MKKGFLKNRLAIALGLLFVVLMAWSYFSKIPAIDNLVTRFNNSVYDLLLQANLKKLPPIKSNEIGVIAIDDTSIAEQGRWPWDRKKMTQLVAKLQEMGASVIAFDIMFSESENNLITQALKEVDSSPQKLPTDIHSAMTQLIPSFDYDSKFGDTLKQGDHVLGFVLNPSEATSSGMLPEPISENRQTFKIPEMQSYMGNIPVLQNAAKYAIPDADGTLRHAALILALKGKVYPSLSLEATRLFLLSNQVTLVTSDEPKPGTLKGVQLDNLLIPTNEYGEVLIPFRGEAYTFPFFSATDILENRINKSEIESKILFIGATATGLGDLKPTAVANNYPGVEVHASIASAILDHYFPTIPAWGKKVEFSLILVLGIISAIIFPFLTAPWLALIAITAVGVWILVSTWLWVSYSILISLLFPLLTVFLLAFINMVNSYLVSSNQRKEIKSIFGQYVPQNHVDSILKSSNEALLEGENKELTVLFSDICGFTTMSEKLTAPQLKTQLNTYLTAMTGVIFELGGTIDKYVGDMIMAFWNAPIVENEHAKKAVLAGLKMQRELKELNQTFIDQNLPDINIGVGINTGMMNVGDMGSKYRRAYTAIGDAVNLASRLEGMCRQYHVEIIVGPDTYEQTKNDFVYIHLDKVRVKGKHQGVDIYMPVGLTKDVGAQELEEIKIFNSALSQYFKQQWKEAEILFNKLTTAYPSKSLYSVYPIRIQHFQKHPPAKDWDGTYIHETK